MKFKKALVYALALIYSQQCVTSPAWASKGETLPIEPVVQIVEDTEFLQSLNDISIPRDLPRELLVQAGKPKQLPQSSNKDSRFAMYKFMYAIVVLAFMTYVVLQIQKFSNPEAYKRSSTLDQLGGQYMISNLTLSTSQYVRQTGGDLLGFWAPGLKFDKPEIEKLKRLQRAFSALEEKMLKNEAYFCESTALYIRKLFKTLEESSRNPQASISQELDKIESMLNYPTQLKVLDEKVVRKNVAEKLTNIDKKVFDKVQLWAERIALHSRKRLRGKFYLVIRGGPSTGKTHLARRIMEALGLDYEIMNLVGKPGNSLFGVDSSLSNPGDFAKNMIEKGYLNTPLVIDEAQILNEGSQAMNVEGAKLLTDDDNDEMKIDGLKGQKFIVKHVPVLFLTNDLTDIKKLPLHLQPLFDRAEVIDVGRFPNEDRKTVAHQYLKYLIDGGYGFEGYRMDLVGEMQWTSLHTQKYNELIEIDQKSENDGIRPLLKSLKKLVEIYVLRGARQADVSDIFRSQGGKLGKPVPAT